MVRKRSLDITALYSEDPNGPYFYQNGINPSAAAAVVLSAAPVLPGFLASVGVLRSVPSVFNTIYYAAWPVGFVLSIAFYLIFMRMAAQRQVAAGTVALN